jgi:hypothetical protein
MEKQQAELEINMIKKIMEDSRRIVIDDGVGYIIWGVLVMAGLIATYAAIISHNYQYIPWAWIILMGGGWIYTIIINVKKERRRKIRTFAGKILGGLWISSGIAMTIIGFAGPGTGAISGYAVSPMISIVLGVAYFVSGIVYSQPWIRNLAIGWWAGAVLMLLWPGSYTLLVFAAMMALLQVLPGIILYHKFKKEYKPNKNG